MESIKGIGSDIYSGMERVSWYSSCLIPSYHDVCDELLSEEKRMYLSIVSLYRYRDVIAQMLYLYFERVITDSENGNEQNRVRKMDSKVTGLVKNIPTNKAARLAIALGLANPFPNLACSLKSSSNGLHAAYLTLSWRFNSLERNRSALLLPVA
jgi:hypothetical protein